MKKLLLITTIILLAFQFGYTQSCASGAGNGSSELEKKSEAPSFEKTMAWLAEKAEQYASYRTEANSEGYSSSYNFSYDEVSGRGKFIATTVVFGEKIKREGEVERTSNLVESKTPMVPEKHYEYEYIFDFGDFDAERTELVSWRDDFDEFNPDLTQASQTKDPSQTYRLKYPYFRVKFHILGGRDEVLVRGMGEETRCSSVSLYFRDKYYAENYVEMFNHAVRLCREKTGDASE